MFITGAVHGDEINGTGVIRQIIQERPFDLQAGALVLVPVVNLPAFEQLSRYSPDRRDLNRSFPGNDRGSLTSRLADVVFSNIVSRCDYGIDLHTAAVRRTNYPNLRADLNDEATRDLVRWFGAEVVINSTGPAGSLRRTATEVGCPTVVLEAGEVWKVEPSVVEYALRGIRNVLVGLKMVTGTRAKPKFRCVAGRTKWIRAEKGGFLQFHVRPGHVIKAGDPIATNTNLAGQTLSTLVSPGDAIVLGMTTLPAVSPGDPVAHLAFPRGTTFEKMVRVMESLPEESLLNRLNDDLATNVQVSSVSHERGEEGRGAEEPRVLDGDARSG